MQTISVEVHVDQAWQGGDTHNLVYGPVIPFTLTIDDEQFQGGIRPNGDIRWPIDWYSDPPEEAKYIVLWATHWTLEETSEGASRGDPYTAEQWLEEFSYQFTTEVEGGIHNDKFKLKEAATA